MRDLHELAIRVTQLHHDLMQAGLYKTGHKMHEVVQKIGYEIAEKSPPQTTRKGQ